MSADLRATDLSLGTRLKGVTVALRSGEVTAICGPNGAGKSTLLSCLAGLTVSDAGAVTLEGEALSPLPARRRAQAIGYLPQGPEVAWDVTVDVLVALGRLPWHDAASPQGQAAVEAAIATMDLQPLRTRPVSRLSGGERARALMARVLATQPRWLLADEPLASLDVGQALALMKRLREQADAGRGVVLVLHDLATAMNHADRVIVLKDGRLATDGEPDQSLAADIIGAVWGCEARWLGDPGSRALSVS